MTTLHDSVVHTDHIIIKKMQQWFVPTARVAIADRFVWFGFLNAIGLSPASTLAHGLFDQEYILYPLRNFLYIFCMVFLDVDWVLVCTPVFHQACYPTSVYTHDYDHWTTGITPCRMMAGIPGSNFGRAIYH